MFINELFSFPFFQRALIAGICVAILAGVAGVYVVLRRAAFFGDAIAHTALVGTALGLLWSFSPLVGAIGIGLFIALTLPWVQQRSRVPLDTFLGVLLPSALGLAVILVSALPGYQPELMSYLFGSILSTTWEHVAQLVALCGIGATTYAIGHRQFLAVTVDEEYARLRGTSTVLAQTVLNIFLVMVIVMSIQIVGAILVTALLVIPSVIATRFARSLQDLFVMSPLVAVVGVLCGILLSVVFNFPTGPTIAVFLGTVCFGVMIAKR